MFLWDNREAFASLWSLLGSSFGGIRYGKSQTLPPSQHEAPIPVCYDPIWLGGWLLMPFPEQLNSWQLNSFMTKHLFVLCPQSPNLEASTGFKVPPKAILWLHDLKNPRNWGLWRQNLLDVGCPSLCISHRICGSFYLVLIFCNPHPLIQIFFFPASFPEVVELLIFLIPQCDIERNSFCPNKLLRDAQEFSFRFLQGLFRHTFPLLLGIFPLSKINTGDLFNICSTGIKKKKGFKSSHKM